MTATLNASTSNGVILTSDTSGSLAIQSNGTTIATAGATGLQISTYNPAASLISSGANTATTSGTSVTITGIPSWARRVTIIVNGVQLSGSSYPQIQLGSGSIQTTGYLNTTVFVSNTTPSYAVSTTGMNLSASGNSAYKYMLNVICTLAGSNTWVMSFNGAISNSGAAVMGGTNVTLSGALDRLSISSVNGTDTFTAGSINILYE